MESSAASLVSGSSKKIRKVHVRWKCTTSTHYLATPTLVDVSRTWFSADDYVVFRQRAKILAKLAQEIGQDAMETYCNDTYRGLEFILDDEKRGVRNTRGDLGWAVILEDSGSKMGERNQFKWERAVVMYKAVSKGALKDAQLIAQRDVAPHREPDCLSLDGIEEASFSTLPSLDVTLSLSSTVTSSPPSLSNGKPSPGVIYPPSKEIKTRKRLT